MNSNSMIFFVSLSEFDENKKMISWKTGLSYISSVSPAPTAINAAIKSHSAWCLIATRICDIKKGVTINQSEIENQCGSPGWLYIKTPITYTSKSHKMKCTSKSDGPVFRCNGSIRHRRRCDN